MGLKQLVPRVSNLWKNQRDELLASANEIIAVLARQAGKTSGEALDPSLLEAGYTGLMGKYDKTFGGFGTQPKFPSPHQLVFLLRQGEPAGIATAEHTLEAMRKGGIFDQVGFGFHRYSTDREWLVPHFEKMLYDQALLALAYTEAYELARNPFHRQVAEEIFEYVLRDMQAPGGGFYSAEDADSDGEEGLFYLWTADEMESILGSDASFVSKLWNISPAGNYRDEATGQTAGKNIPHLSALPSPAERQRLSNPRKKLLAVRERRIHPPRDTKILADWNGLMVAALAKAGRAFADERLTRAALRANAFVQAKMKREDGGLWHRWREGQPAIPAHLDDYAFQILGLLELYETTLDLQHLETALEYSAILSKSFVDKKGGGYFMVSDDAEKLIVRPKELYDGAIPSGNSVQMLNLLRLARLTGQPELEAQAIETGKAFGASIARSPSGFTQALIALQFASGETREIVVVGPRGRADTRQMLAAINAAYDPGKVLLFKDPAQADALEKIAPFTRELNMVDGKTTVYLCRNFACERPINSPKELEARFVK